MSCTSNGLRAGRAAIATGLSSLSTRLGYTSGVMLADATQILDRVGQTTASATALALKVVEPTGPRAVRKRAAVGKLARAAVTVGTRLAGLAPVLTKVKIAVKVSELATGTVGTAVATLSETDKVDTVTVERRRFLFFKAKRAVNLRRSSLTKWLNGRDVIGRRQILKSDGLMFTTGGKSWHQGTTSFKMGQGRRTITHLQSLSYPAENYYFDRPLGNQQAVALATGQAKAETIPGYVGRISKVETLCPTWAGTKKALILARLHWKDEGGRRKDE